MLIQLALFTLLLALLLASAKAAWLVRIRRFGLLVALSSLIFMAPPVLDRLVGAWEHLQPRSNLVCDGHYRDLIVLPGGTAKPVATPVTAWDQLNEASIRRLQAAFAIFHRSGAQRLLIPGNQQEVAAMSTLAREAGIPEQALVVDAQSINTWLAAEWLARQQLDDAVLITSALHMRRTLWSIRAHDLLVCPIPVDYKSVKSSPWRILPNWADAERADLLRHELLGSLWYRLRHRAED